jgi:hypothetical protein
MQSLEKVWLLLSAIEAECYRDLKSKSFEKNVVEQAEN